MLTLLSKSNTLVNRFKTLLRPQRGPEAVLDSLCKGLNELKFEYILNPKIVSYTVAVLQNTKALQLAIELKKQGKINKLLAGPNIVVTPKDASSILENTLIDKVIVPSQWVKDFYISISPILQNKTFIWTAGVDDPNEPTPLSERDTILVYQKNGSIDLLNRLVESLKLKGYKVDIIKYGSYKQADYFDKLNHTKLAIFLTQSESQGIAQQEAWMRDIPTLVWNQGIWQYNEYRWKDTKISSPYLTVQCGRFFNTIEDFDTKIQEMLNNLNTYSPRQYALEYFTHKKSAEEFMKIINE